MIPPLTTEERTRLLDEYAAALQRYEHASRQRDLPASKRAFAAAEEVKAAYYERLPRMALATCPYCEQPFLHSIDPFGFDGFWWFEAPAAREPRACPHVCVLRGAVRLNRTRIRGGAEEVRSGPEVPYVIPRLLEFTGMVMVIGELPLDGGHTAYPLVYFAERRPPADELTSEWARETYHYRTAAGASGWRVANDPWEFDLQPWIAAGKLRWAATGSENRTLASPTTACPYLNLPGERQEMIVVGNEARGVGVPDGQPFFPLD